jgi:hypothetical protein
MTTSAYNLGNAGLASKILRTKDLMRVAGVEGDWGIGFRLPAFGFRVYEIAGSLGVRWGIPPLSPFEFSQ